MHHHKKDRYAKYSADAATYSQDLMGKNSVVTATFSTFKGTEEGVRNWYQISMERYCFRVSLPMFLGQYFGVALAYEKSVA
jgi:hypothetical protein